MQSVVREKKILLISAPIAITAGVIHIAEELGAVVISVRKEEYNRTFRSLLGMGGGRSEPPGYDGPGIPEPVLVMYSFTDGELERLLASMRERHISIPLKAMITRTNINWTPLRLYRELRREHTAMSRGSE